MLLSYRYVKPTPKQPHDLTSELKIIKSWKSYSSLSYPWLSVVKLLVTVMEGCKHAWCTCVWRYHTWLIMLSFYGGLEDYFIIPYFGCIQYHNTSVHCKFASSTCYDFLYLQVSHGVAELAETVGNAAANASEQLAAVAEKVDQVEEKKFPRRRNGLD